MDLNNKKRYFFTTKEREKKNLKKKKKKTTVRRPYVMGDLEGAFYCGCGYSNYCRREIISRQ